MKKTLTVTIDEFSEKDFNDAFYEATFAMGIKSGDTIPKNLLDLKLLMVNMLFQEHQKIMIPPGSEVHLWNLK